MRPKLTKDEYVELQRLLRIIQDERQPSGQRRIANAQFNYIYNRALQCPIEA